MAYDYTDSGLSSADAMADAQRRMTEDAKRLHLPAFAARLLAKSFRLRMHCDGLGCPRVGKTSGTLDARGHWSDSSGWVHRADLDFCPVCQGDGQMDAAIQAGVRPRGA